jgi:hypothetical protein
MTDLPASELFRERMRAGLLRVHSRKLAGAKVPDCLREAYDVCASAFEEAGEPLTEELLTERIPAMVFGAAVEHKWEAYPPVRHRGRGAIVGSFLEGGYNPARDEVVPQTELTETFGGYRVMKGCGAAFRRRYLECRIVHWRAEALTPAVAGGFGKAQGPASRGVPTEETAVAGKGGKGAGPIPQFPNRASWLKDRLQERSWNKHDVSRQGGPDRKTVQKILDSQQIREDVLEKLATALSKAPASKKLPNVTVLDVPRD